ncbi:MAG: CoA-binding protein [Desulfobulbaceae bacterium BRH_c16a]|nr:MAG: CoA-binding protein [Desulfobulbaceae bacterium BRH_c16a]
MQKFENIGQSADIAQLLKSVRAIAVVGLSPKENRPSNMVGRYLLDAGYTIYPVNPGHTKILGQTCYADLASVPYPVDIVDIFRKSEDVPAIVEQAVSLNPLPKAIWMQQGIINESAAELALNNGIYVVMDRCMKIDHMNFIQR